MSKGSFTATAVSTIIVPADTGRDHLTVQKVNATTIAIGIGEDAVAGKGIQLINADASLELRGVEAREAIYAIGNGGTGTYQSGMIAFRPGPYSA
jgi:hypothetical protein